jgi:hypothetical protein
LLSGFNFWIWFSISNAKKRWTIKLAAYWPICYIM